MKKILLLTMLMAVTWIYGYSQQRTEAEAAAIAKAFMQNNGYDFKITKSTTPAKIRAKKAGEITPYYIFNDTQKGGFVIVGGQEAMSDILAYSDEDCFDMDYMPPSAAEWLEAYSQSAIIAADYPEKSKAEKRAAAKAFIESNFSLRQNVEPLLGEIKYNQGTPYNKKCPTLKVMQGGKMKTGKAVTGCTQTAMAMLMRYWKWPERPRGSKTYTFNYDYTETTTKQMTLTVNFDSVEPYRWDLMLPRYEGHTYTTEQADAIAILMYHCGISNGAGYGLGGTGAALRPQGLVDYFYYANDWEGDNFGNYKDKPNGFTEYRAMLADELSQGRPIWAAGSNVENTGAHSYIVDGYDLNGLFHFNLGWNGGSNGYYEVAPTPQAPYGCGMYFYKHIHPEGRLTPSSPVRNVVIEAGLGEFNEQTTNISSTLKTLTGSNKFAESLICIVTADTEDEAESHLEGLSTIQGVLLDRADTITGRISAGTVQTQYSERFNIDAPANLDIDAMFASKNSMKVSVASYFANDMENTNYRYAFVYTEDNVKIDGVSYNDVAKGMYPNRMGYENSVPTSVEKDKEYIFEQEIPFPESIENINNTTLIVLMVNADNGTIVNATKVDLEQVNAWREKQKPAFYNEGRLLASSSKLDTYFFDEEAKRMPVPVRINNPLYEPMEVELTAEVLELGENATVQLGETAGSTTITYELAPFTVDSTMMLYLNINDEFKSSTSTVKLSVKYEGNLIADQTVNFDFIETANGINPFTVRVKGTLEELVPKTAIDTITTITVTGRLSGKDISFLRDSLKANVINLSGASIVEGPGIYYGDYTTEDNIIGVRMFYNIDAGTIIMPNTAVEIGNYAFYQNTKLTKAVIGSNTTLIGSYAFSGCSALERITIPASVTELGRNAFKNCPIVCVICESETPAKLGSKVFDGADLANATLVVPNEAAIETYKAQKQWKDFGNIISYDQYLTAIAPVTEEVEITVADGKIIVAEDAEVAIYTFAGKQVATGKAGEYALPAGNYIVKVGNKAIKVRL
ncbi:MAG: C10 family peptidase [Bacteroidaceae bacterium]|nr:C10 family peptidase [Bacteroidaceae bacterium]